VRGLTFRASCFRAPAVGALIIAHVPPLGFSRCQTLGGVYRAARRIAIAATPAPMAAPAAAPAAATIGAEIALTIFVGEAVRNFQGDGRKRNVSESESLLFTPLTAPHPPRPAGPRLGQGLTRPRALL